MTPSPLFKGDVGTNPEALGFVPYHGNNSVWPAPLSKQQKLTPFCALETEAPGQAAAQSASTAPTPPSGFREGHASSSTQAHPARHHPCRRHSPSEADGARGPRFGGAGF